MVVKVGERLEEVMAITFSLSCSYLQFGMRSKALRCSGSHIISDQRGP